jgi:hypothetical protein
LKWREVPITTRQRYMFKLQALVDKHKDELAQSIVKENGKTLADAHGDVFRGLEVVEYSCGIGSQMMGETLDNLSKGIDTYVFSPLLLSLPFYLLFLLLPPLTSLQHISLFLSLMPPIPCECNSDRPFLAATLTVSPWV